MKKDSDTKEKINDEGMKNLVGFFSLLLKIDQRIKKEEKETEKDEKADV